MSKLLTNSHSPPALLEFPECLKGKLTCKPFRKDSEVTLIYFTRRGVMRLRQMTQILARRICCCGRNIQIHGDYRNPVEEKGWLGHSLKRRAPRPLPGQAFIVFLGPLHQRWSSFTTQRFVLGGYLLQTKERVWLNTSKEGICNVKGEVVETGCAPYLEGLAQILGR